MTSRVMTVVALCAVLGRMCEDERCSARFTAVPDRPEEELEVYMNESDVKVPFIEIALITAKGEATCTDGAEMINATRKKARQLGANAIILGRAGRSPVRVFVPVQCERPGHHNARHAEAAAAEIDLSLSKAA